jgi:rRNA maturation RNase YbeY
VSDETIVAGLQAVFRLEQASPEDVSVLLTDDSMMQRLNLQFRGIDAPTDVLTFPLDSDGSGDIAISVPYAQRQAAARGVSLTEELGFLAIHGGLHLLGLDDQSEPDRAEMVRRMNLAAEAAGLTPDLEWSSVLHAAAEGVDQ